MEREVIKNVENLFILSVVLLLSTHTGVSVFLFVGFTLKTI